MKVAILSFEYPPETGYGGIGTYSRNLALGLKEIGIDVHVIAGANSVKNETYLDNDGIKITRCRLGRPYSYGFHSIGKIGYWCSNRLENAFTMYKTFKNLHNRYNFDVVEMPECGAEGLFINNLTTVKSVVKIHTPLYFLGKYNDAMSKDLRIASYFENAGIKNADTLTSPSRFMANKIKNDLNLKNNIHVVPNGLNIGEIDCKRKENFEFRKNFNIPMDSQIILYSGRLEFWKGVSIFEKVIPNVIKEFPNAFFVLAGRESLGYKKNDLIKKLKELGIMEKVIFLGQVPYDDLLTILTQIDIYVAPSIHDNFPYSCLEAMASSCPIVSTTAGGIPEMIENGKSGILVEPNNPEAFSNAILSFLDSPKKRFIFGKNARKRVKENFDYITIAKKTLNIYSL